MGDGELRALAHQRTRLLKAQARGVQHVQKAPVQMNIQLAEVLTDAIGSTGQANIRDIVAGQRDPKVLAQHRNARVKVGGQSGVDGAVRDRPGLEPVCQRQAFLFLAGAVPGHEDRRWQGAVGAHPALDQPGASGAEDGRHLPVAQRLCTRRLLPPPLRADGQIQRQYGHGSQARPNGLLHAHPGVRSLSIKGRRSTNGSNVSAVLPHSNAAPPRWASSSRRWHPQPEADFDALVSHEASLRLARLKPDFSNILVLFGIATVYLRNPQLIKSL